MRKTAHKTSTLVLSDSYPKPTSPAIDTGTPLTGAAKEDIKGVARPVDGNGDGSALWDRGCFEYVP